MIGTVVYFGLKKFCERHLPQEPPPPPPPPNNCTNCNPVHPEWPCTNCPPAPNSLQKSFIPLPLLCLTNTPESVLYEDCSSSGWSDPYGNVWGVYFRTTMQSSTNLVDWKTVLQMRGWVSFGTNWVGLPNFSWPSNSCVILSSSNGVPIVTNWSWEPAFLPTDTEPSQRKFYRLAR